VFHSWPLLFMMVGRGGCGSATQIVHGKDYGFEPFIHTPQLLDRVRSDWRETRPFVDWVLAHAKG